MDLKEWVSLGKPINKIICCDCLEGLKQLPDNYIDLVLTDPPYGILNGVNSVGGGEYV